MTDASGRRWPRWVLPLVAIGAAVAIGVVAYDGGSDGASSDDAGPVSRSSTIAWGPDGSSLWVTSPDDDQVVELDPDTLEPRRSVPVPGQPRELTVAGDDLVVTGNQSTDLTLVGIGPPDDGGDAGGSSQVERMPIPCGGSRSVVVIPDAAPGPASSLALVTCPTDDLVAIVNLKYAATVASWPLPGRPTGIVRDGDRLTISTAADGVLHTFDTSDVAELVPADPPLDGDPLPVIETTPVASDAVWTDDDRTASQLGPLDAGSRGTLGTYQVVDNANRLETGEIGRSNYGNPVDGRARLEPAIAGPCGARFAEFAQPSRVLSGPVALAASPVDDLVWVVGQYTRSVSVARCDGGAAKGQTDTVASFDVGEGARGIVLDETGETAYVDVGFDHEVARLRLPDDVEEVVGDAPIERGAPDLVVRRDIDDQYLSSLAQAGRRMFSDATDTHLTPFGVVTCASCHPDAGDDALTWRIETLDPETREAVRKVRRTPAAWQIDASTKPLHWNGEFTTNDDLILTTVQQLLGGDGLLVDTAAISAYIDEALPPPAVPSAFVDLDAVARGRALFAADALGCASCHSGDAGTDGLAHDVLPPSAIDDGDLDSVMTPPLFGIRGKAPFGHDARAASLDELLAQHGDGEGAPIAMTDEERADVIAYLSSR